MSRFNLRQKPRVSYYEPEEPSLDEYVFCDKCQDHVYEYCSIHGPLLVIPDDKVPAQTSLPSFVPRAALTIPHVFLHLARSYIPDAGIGVFSTLTLPKGVRFGPYKGQRTTEVNSMYCWQIYDRNHRPTHVVDAANADSSNWMRYVNCARYWDEQNLVAYQYQGQLYYRTIKIIPRFTELLVFYGSEFAHSLNIDLKLYNSPPGYAQKLGASISKKPRLEPENQKKVEEIPKKVNKKLQSIASKTVAVDEPKASGTVKNKKQGVKTKYEVPKTTSANKNIDKNNNLPEPPKLICNDCNRSFATKPLLIQHIGIHNQVKHDAYFNCTHCNYRTVTKDTLEKHMNLHDESRPHVCGRCGYRFKTSRCLKTHVDSKHMEGSNKLHTCDICLYKTNHKTNMNRHLIVHTGKKDYECSICKKRFGHKNHLTVHIRTHTGDKPYQCSICQKRFIQKNELTVHIRTHTGDKPYQCSICKKRFSLKCNLTVHIRTHTGDKPYQCSICKKRFRHKCHLTVHIRTHTGDKPYQCSICKKRFRHKCHLTVHIRTHTGDKPYQCSICKKRFRHKCHLTVHIRTHTGDKPYQCSICKKLFSLKPNLTKHLRIHTSD